VYIFFEVVAQIQHVAMLMFVSHRAGQIRKNAANRTESSPSTGDDDVSSDEEEYDEIDTDDVDSDEDDDEPVVITEGNPRDVELSGQQDFVHF
jgi:hypothetical protein